MANSGLVGILLTDGQNGGFDSRSLLQALPDGTPIAVAAARKLKQAGLHCISVPPRSNRHSAVCCWAKVSPCAMTALLNRAWHSLAAAIRSTPEAGGWLVTLADMPFIAPATISLLAYALRGGASPSAPYYNGRRGHPVGFARSWFTHLNSLQDDREAREPLSSGDTALFQVPCDDAGILAESEVPATLSCRGEHS